jgi:hypothetical protein
VTAAAAELLDGSRQQLNPAVRTRLLHEAAGDPLALIELPVAAARSGPNTRMPGVLPLTERLEQAFAARVAELPEPTRLLLLVAALDDGDGDRRPRRLYRALPAPADALQIAHLAADGLSNRESSGSPLAASSRHRSPCSGTSGRSTG